MIGETANLLSSLCGIIDRHEGLSLGCTWQECQIRLAIDLYRGLHGACSKQLTKEPCKGPPRPFVRHASEPTKDIFVPPLQIFSLALGLAFDPPSSAWPMASAAS